MGSPFAIIVGFAGLTSPYENKSLCGNCSFGGNSGGAVPRVSAAYSGLFNNYPRCAALTWATSLWCVPYLPRRPSRILRYHSGLDTANAGASAYVGEPSIRARITLWRLPMRAHPLPRARGARSVVCLPLHRMPETILVRFRHFLHGEKSRLRGIRRPSRVLVAHHRVRAYVGLRVLPAVRVAPVASKQRASRDVEHQSGDFRPAGRPYASGSHLGVEQVAGCGRSRGCRCVRARAGVIRHKMRFERRM